MLERVTGFLIKTQDFRESNKIVTIFSKKFGKLPAIARGAKKPNSRMAAVTQPFIYGEFLVYIGKGLSTLQQGDVIHSFRNIREDIRKTTYAAYISEMTEKTLTSKEPHPYIFQQFYETMHWISDYEEAMIPIMMYEIKLYQIAGISPVVEECVVCHDKNALRVFSVSEGGVLCQNCMHRDKHAIYLSQTLLKILVIFKQVNLERVGNISVKKKNIIKLRNIFDTYYDRYGGYTIKSRNVLKQLDLLRE